VRPVHQRGVDLLSAGNNRAKYLIAIFEDPSNLFDMDVYIRKNLHHRGLLYPTDRLSKTLLSSGVPKGANCMQRNQ
jgi:hypothetical protein